MLFSLLRCWFVGTTKAMWTWRRSTTSCLYSCNMKRRGFSALCCHMATFTSCGSNTATCTVSLSWSHKEIIIMRCSRLWTVTWAVVESSKYIYSSTVHKYKFEVLVLYLSISILCYISEVNIVLLTALHLSNSFSYFSDCSFWYSFCPGNFECLWMKDEVLKKFSYFLS